MVELDKELSVHEILNLATLFKLEEYQLSARYDYVKKGGESVPWHLIAVNDGNEFKKVILLLKEWHTILVASLLELKKAYKKKPSIQNLIEEILEIILQKPGASKHYSELGELLEELQQAVGTRV